MAAKFCYKCGAPLSPDVKFCTKCGTPVPQPAAPADTIVRDEKDIMPAAPQMPETEPINQQPAPEPPVYQQPVPEPPVYQQPAPEQPVYQQPGYQQPAPEQFAAGSFGAPPGGGAPNFSSVPENGGSSGKKKLLIGIIAAVVLCAAMVAIVLILGKGGSGSKDSKDAGKADTEEASDDKDDAAEAKDGDEESDSSEEEDSSDDASADDAVFREDGDYSGEGDADGKDSEGLALPEVGDGETLYIGYGELPDIGLTKMALVVSADGKTAHGLTIMVSDFADTIGGSSVPFSNMTTSYSSEYTLPISEEALGDCTLKDVHIEGDYVYVVLDYVFNNIAFGDNSEDEKIPLGETEIWMKKAGD